MLPQKETSIKENKMPVNEYDQSPVAQHRITALDKFVSLPEELMLRAVGNKELAYQQADATIDNIENFLHVNADVADVERRNKAKDKRRNKKKHPYKKGGRARSMKLSKKKKVK